MHKFFVVREWGITRKAYVAWEKVCQPKQYRGLNLRQVLIWNKASLIKQLWVLALKKDSLWVKWIHSYYIKTGYVMSCNFPKCISWMLRKIVDMRAVVSDWGGMSTVASSVKFSVSKAYHKLLVVQPHVAWGSLMVRNWSSSRSLFIVWLVCHQCLATVDMLLKWGLAIHDQCCLCKAAVESHDHLFGCCRFIQEVRRIVMGKFNYDSQAVTLH